MKEHLQILNKSQLFLGLTDNEILSAIKCLGDSVRTYKKNTTVFHEGDLSSFFAVVLSGEILLKKTDYNGETNIIARMFPSQIVAAASVFSSQNTHPFDAEAIVDSQILTFNKEKLTNPCQSACHFHSIIIKNLLTAISDNNVLLAEKIDVLTKRTIKEKILSFLYLKSKKTKNKLFAINFTRNEMAQFLSVDRSALSRELAKMQVDGILEYQANHFKLL